MPPVKKQKPTVSLDDLAPADRERLLAEARTTVELDPVARREAMDEIETEKAARRSKAIAALMSDRDHLRDCPGGRVEAFAATRPPQPAKGLPAKSVTTVRCIECGGATIIDQPYEATVAAIAEAEAEVDEAAAA